MANHGDIDEIVQVKRSFAGIFFNAVTRKIEKKLTTETFVSTFWA
jgi:hypothetical protein